MAPNQGKILIKAFFVKCDLKSLINSALLSPQKLWSCPCSSSAPSSPLIEGVCFPQEHCATIAVLPFRSHHRPIHCTDLTFIWVIWPLHSLNTETADAFLLQDFAECLPLCSGWKIPEFLCVSVCGAATAQLEGERAMFHDQNHFEGISFTPWEEIECFSEVCWEESTSLRKASCVQNHPETVWSGEEK